MKFKLLLIFLGLAYSNSFDYLDSIDIKELAAKPEGQTPVAFSISIESVSDIDEVNMDFTVTMIVTQSWNDSRLVSTDEEMGEVIQGSF